MGSPVKISGANLPGLKALTERMLKANREVWVGVPVGAGNAHEIDAHGTEKESTTSLAVVAAANEFGVEIGQVPAQQEVGKKGKTKDVTLSIIKIPERSFLRAGLKRGQAKFQRLNRINLQLVLLGDKTIEQALAQLGNGAAGEVKREFQVGKFTPNAPSTLARKKPKTHPLENSLHLKNSITFVVAPEGSR